MKRTLCVLALAALLPVPALADGHSEIVNAAQHAGFAAAASDIATAHAHLHHALNCLVGPDGGGFDAHEMNPCANAGNGAITDNAKPSVRKALEVAADKLNVGIRTGDLAKAQAAASAAAAILKQEE